MSQTGSPNKPFFPEVVFISYFVTAMRKVTAVGVKEVHIRVEIGNLKMSLIALPRKMAVCQHPRYFLSLGNDRLRDISHCTQWLERLCL